MVVERNGTQLACSVKVGEKGQIVIPKEMRDMFGIVPGESLLIMADKDRGIAIPPKNTFEQLAKLVFGENDK